MLPLSLPVNVRLADGAPLPLATLAELPCQASLGTMCGELTSSTRLSVSPFLIVIDVCKNWEPPICTVGPVGVLLVSTIAHAANKMVRIPKMVKPKISLLYMRVPFDIVLC